MRVRRPVSPTRGGGDGVATFVFDMPVTPQFPLGTVLFPSMVLPFHVFEPRYRVMVERVLADDGTFGVVLIERGSDVGGEDHRSDLGTIAKIVGAEQLSDGRWHLVTVGTERFRVNSWLPDDPYPVADIDLWPDEEPAERTTTTIAHGDVVAKFRRCMTLASEAGLDVGPVLELLRDIEPGCLQMAAMAPLSTLDKQTLLASPGPTERLPLLSQLIDDAVTLLEGRLCGFGEASDSPWDDLT